VGDESPNASTDRTRVERDHAHPSLDKAPRDLVLSCEEKDPGTVTVLWHEPPFSDKGSYGSIYRATLNRNGNVTDVAVKLLRNKRPPDALQKKLQKEARNWSSLQHDRLLNLLGTCQFDIPAGDNMKPCKGFCMVSPFMKNGTALDWLKRNPAIDRAALLCQVAEALAYLHDTTSKSEVVVHGDLKADNILISGDGTALLADFGLSRVHEDVAKKINDASITSQATRSAGASRFRAPELIFTTPTPSKTPASDVWAYGMLVYEVYTCTVPFEAINDASFHVKIDKGETPPRPQKSQSPWAVDCPTAVWAVAQSCWSRRPEGRPAMLTVLTNMRAAATSSTDVSSPSLLAMFKIW